MTRKEFLRLAAGPAALAALPAQGAIRSEPVPDFVLFSPGFQFSYKADTVDRGIWAKLFHSPTGIVLANSLYSYSCPPPSITNAKPSENRLTLSGHFGNGVLIEQSYTVEPSGKWIEEGIKLTNTCLHPVTLNFRCGLVLHVVPGTLQNYIFTAVPYRREPNGGRDQYNDYTLDQILHERCRSRLRNVPLLDTNIGRQMQPQLFTEDYLSEAWALTDGKNGFLISKYNQANRQFSILDGVPLSPGSEGLRWGGAGGPMMNPEGCLRLKPGQTYDFGVTRITPFSGDLTQGFYTYRTETESRGHRISENYDPPSQWNELYDNKLWWGGDSANPVLRKKFYTLDDMKFAASRAQDMGLEALYCDPGWDTPQSSHIWGAERLGPLPDFLAMLKNQYGGLRLSLHAPLSSWSGQYADLPPGTAMIDDHGNASNRPCGASNQYVDITVKRMGDLAVAGVAFLMFDGTAYFGECWAKDHGHSHPATTAEYADMENKIAYDIHRDHPDILIEMHDQLFGGVSMRYCPSYYGQGLGMPGKKGWDEIWAFELMWNPMEDLVGGHSIALYYFNLAYSIPLYIHIDLRQDNPQCLMLWWNISTCRHLGVGGTHADPNVVAAQKKVIATYRRLKKVFCRGIFYGIDEMTHVHVDRDLGHVVINCFNFEDHPTTRDVRFDPAKFGIPSTVAMPLQGASLKMEGPVYVAQVSIPAFGHTLLELGSVA